MAGNQCSSRADQKHFNCRMSFLFHFLKAKSEKVGSHSVFPICLTVLPKAQLIRGKRLEPTVEKKKKMKKNEFITWACT